MIEIAPAVFDSDSVSCADKQMLRRLKLDWRAGSQDEKPNV